MYTNNECLKPDNFFNKKNLRKLARVLRKLYGYDKDEAEDNARCLLITRYKTTRDASMELLNMKPFSGKYFMLNIPIRQLMCRLNFLTPITFPQTLIFHDDILWDFESGLRDHPKFTIETIKGYKIEVSCRILDDENNDISEQWLSERRNERDTVRAELEEVGFNHEEWGNDQTWMFVKKEDKKSNS